MRGLQGKEALVAGAAPGNIGAATAIASLRRARPWWPQTSTSRPLGQSPTGSRRWAVRHCSFRRYHRRGVLPGGVHATGNCLTPLRKAGAGLRVPRLH